MSLTYSQLTENLQILEEGKAQNGHITHFEDVLFYGGAKGVKAAINLVVQLIKNPAKLRVSLKIDGSPMVAFGLDPLDKRFFVAKKSIFNQEPKVYKSHDSIESDLRDKSDLVHKLQYAYHYLKPLVQSGIYQGDMLYTRKDLNTRNIDGQGYITFHPNTLTYGVPEDSKLYRRVVQSKMGIALHTKLVGRDFKTLKPIYDFDQKELKRTKNVWMYDPYIDPNDIDIQADKINVFIKEILNKLPNISKFVSEVALNQNLAQIFEAYHNSLVRNGHITNNASKYVQGLQQFVQSKPKKYHNYFKDQAMLMAVFEIHSLLTDIKMEIVKSLNNIKDLNLKAFIRRTNGVTNESEIEGYVVAGQGMAPLKFINRMEFAHHNFDDANIEKGWTK